jgi:hypothetical protein
MTTATLNKTVVEPKWTTTQIQEQVTRIYAQQMLTAQQVLAKYGEQATQEFGNLMRENKLNHYRSLNVTTPIELVKAMSEFEANVFGSKIEIWGDDKSATLKYNSCGMWNAIQKNGKLTSAQEEQMGAKFEQCMQAMTHELGFKLETKFEGECCTMTFSK